MFHTLKNLTNVLRPLTSTTVLTEKDMVIALDPMTTKESPYYWVAQVIKSTPNGLKVVSDRQNGATDLLRQVKSKKEGRLIYRKACPTGILNFKYYISSDAFVSHA